MADRERPSQPFLKEEKDEEIIRFDLSTCKHSAKRRYFFIFFY
jgi:hypothetical protein